MATLATALEAYGIDNNSYPPDTVSSPPQFRNFGALTTPVGYISVPPEDPFSVVAVDLGPYGTPFEPHQYRYGTPLDPTVKRCWAVTSDGPDRLPNLGLYPYNGFQPEHLAYAYDPSNGTISGGNI